MTTCSGIDATTGSGTEITFNGNIESVRPTAVRPSMWIAPGWVDIQVNGFAGVDYNSPATPHEEIARSVQVQYSAGMTRFYPTVITGSPDDMLAALKNLARAKDTLTDLRKTLATVDRLATALGADDGRFNEALARVSAAATRLDGVLADAKVGATAAGHR